MTQLHSSESVIVSNFETFNHFHCGLLLLQNATLKCVEQPCSFVSALASGFKSFHCCKSRNTVVYGKNVSYSPKIGGLVTNTHQERERLRTCGFLRQLVVHRSHNSNIPENGSSITYSWKIESFSKSGFASFLTILCYNFA